uniref:VWFA domain-containing protein n=1 Tax=Leersia perrieri TaxID=77586 RepID=A0A0D9Y175_9ORYZ
MAGQAEATSSVMQLSTFTKNSTIPVSVNLKMPKAEIKVPVDIVAMIDVGQSMQNHDGSTNTTRLGLVKQAMKNAINNLAGGHYPNGNRLSLLAFDDKAEVYAALADMNNKDKRDEYLKIVDGFIPGNKTRFSNSLARAAQILDGRKAGEKNRLAFIILLSDGNDSLETLTPNMIPKSYPIHSFGFTSESEAGSGTYTLINEYFNVLINKLDQLSKKLTSISTDAHGVVISDVSSVDGGDVFEVSIGVDQLSADVFLGDIASDEERDFTVKMEVPLLQGSSDVKRMILPAPLQQLDPSINRGAISFGPAKLIDDKTNGNDATGLYGAVPLLNVKCSYKRSLDSVDETVGTDVVVAWTRPLFPPRPN